MNDDVNMAIKGDNQAFINIICKNSEKLFRIALSYLKNRDEALEAVQETTYRAYKNINKLNKIEYFDTWLVRILINYCNDELKRKKFVLPLTTTPSDKSEEIIQRLTLEKAVEKLSPLYRETIILRYFHDMKISTISRIMNCPEGTVKVRVRRALKILEKQMEKDGVIYAAKNGSRVKTNWQKI